MVCKFFIISIVLTQFDYCPITLYSILSLTVFVYIQ